MKDGDTVGDTDGVAVVGVKVGFVVGDTDGCNDGDIVGFILGK